jgi:ABC-type antimicrobial peptide transport system permease subunit
MSDIVDESASERRFESFLMLSFALTGLVLAVVGVYAVVASLTKQRTQEIGVRMALGAQHGDVVRMILGEGFRMVLVGAAVGLTAALILSSMLKDVLYGVSSTDAATFLLVAAVIVAAASSACFGPARRAALMDPVRALRHE